MSTDLKVSIVIATYNMANVIGKTLRSCDGQKYKNKEIIVYDDCSTDNTSEVMEAYSVLGMEYICGEKNLGVGSAFNEAINRASGDIVVLMCADDLFTNEHVITDMVKIFEEVPEVGHVSRYYYQFVHKYSGPVRAWRSKNPIIQANNPSGLAFRKEALKHKWCSNKMFIETSFLVSSVLDDDWEWRMLEYDAIAVRVHDSTSTKPGYWLKRRVSSPVMDWHQIGGVDIAKDYVSFIQIKNGFTMNAVFEEIYNFIKLRPLNLLHPMFWFYSTVAVITPRPILRKLPHFYRKHIGKRITKEIKRP